MTMFTGWKRYRSESNTFHYILFYTFWGIPYDYIIYFYNEHLKKVSYLSFPIYSFNSKNELFVDDLYCVSTVVWTILLSIPKENTFLSWKRERSTWLFIFNQIRHGELIIFHNFGILT